MRAGKFTPAARIRDPFRVSQAEIDRATRWPIGQAVTLTQDDGVAVETVTRSLPWRLGNGTWVILVAGVTGCYALARVAER